MTGSRSTDRILPFTRILAAVIIPFLVAASALLYLLPARTDELFAWTITPSLSAMLLASAYLGGIWFFVQVLRERAWHRVARGFPAVLAFATLAGIATFLHWDRFHFGHISFITWVTLYVTTPFLVLAAILVNRRQDPGRPDDHDYSIPLLPRVLLAGIGLVALVTGLWLFIAPELLIDSWAWQLTPLTARILGAMFTLPGMVNVWMLLDRRWSSFRAVFEAEIFSLGFIVAALALSSSDLVRERPVTGLVVGGLIGSLIAFLALYLWCERKARRTGTPVA